MARKTTERQLFWGFDWQFSHGDRSLEQALSSSKDWRSVNLPHDWSRDFPYTDDVKDQGSGGFVVTGVGWYKKSFKLPEGCKGKFLSLLFDGAYMDSTVWINGVKAGGHFYGYSPFEIDISTLVKPDGENTIVVRVDNSAQPNSRWYSGSGIIRDVWLNVLDPVHIETYGVWIMQDHVDDVHADLSIRTKIFNTSGEKSNTIVRTMIYDADDKPVTDYGQTTGLLLDAGEKKELHQILGIPTPRFWDIDDPYMYKIVVQLYRGDVEIDRYENTFGVRTIEYDPRKGFLLNGRQVKILGGAVHQDGGGVGAAVPKKVWTRRLAKLKESGMNGIRTAHNTPDDYLLEVCDEMGFLVMDEVFDEWALIKESKSRLNPDVLDRGYGERFEQEYEYDLRIFLQRDRNHPSVVMWSVGNEVVDQDTVDGFNYLKHMKEICREMDPTRPITVGCDHIAAEPLSARDEFLNEMDLVGYNYVDRWGTRAETFYEDDKLDNPDWMQIGAENVSVRSGARGVYLTKFDENDFRSMPYHCHPVAGSALLRFTMTRDYVIGDYLFPAVEYLGEARAPAKGSSGGLLDGCAFPKDCFYFYKSVLNPNEHTLHLLPHWNMDVEEGTILSVLCYTSLDTVELFHNGKSYGKESKLFPKIGRVSGKTPTTVRPTTNNMWLKWHVPFIKGELLAVGYLEGVEVARTTVKTVGEAKTIKLSTVDNEIEADGRDIAHIEVRLFDEKENFAVTAKNRINVEVSGGGTLLALDNGDQTCKELYTSNTRPAFNGLMLITVQAGFKKEDINVTVTSDGLKGDSIKIKVK